MLNNRHVIINGVRYHKTVGGNLPGVTTVLGETKSRFSKMAIQKWKNKVGHDTADAIFKNSIKRGDQFHATIEAFLKDTPPNKVCPQVIQLWKLVRPFVEQAKASKDLWIESHIHHPEGFAGTPDLVCYIDGKLTVVDWKNSRKPKTRSSVGDYLKQVAAYSKGFEYINGLEVEQGIVVCAVVPDQYISVTNPELGNIEPELQLFKMKPKSIETHWKGFKKRLRQFEDLQANPWFTEEVDTAF